MFRVVRMFWKVTAKFRMRRDVANSLLLCRRAACDPFEKSLDYSMHKLEDLIDRKTYLKHIWHNPDDEDNYREGSDAL